MAGAADKKNHVAPAPPLAPKPTSGRGKAPASSTAAPAATPSGKAAAAAPGPPKRVPSAAGSGVSAVKAVKRSDTAPAACAAAGSSGVSPAPHAPRAASPSAPAPAPCPVTGDNASKPTPPPAEPKNNLQTASTSTAPVKLPAPPAPPVPPKPSGLPADGIAPAEAVTPAASEPCAPTDATAAASSSTGEQQLPVEAPTAAPSVARFIKGHHGHPFGLVSERDRHWPRMFGPEGANGTRKGPCVICGWATHLKEDYLRCTAGCNWNLCPPCDRSCPHDEAGAAWYAKEETRLAVLRESEKGPLASAAVVARLLAAAPSAAAEADKEGRLALHGAAEKGAPLAVVAALITAHADAVKTKTRDTGRLPLHLLGGDPAAGAEAAEVATLLLKCHPEGAKEEDSRGSLPLHQAASRGASSALLGVLLQAHPDAAEAPDGEGRTPLHLLAASPRATAAAAAALVQARPKAASLEAQSAKLPLHVACENAAPADVVAAIISGHPAAVEAKTDSLQLPLHVVAAGQSWGSSGPGAPLQESALLAARALLKAFPPGAAAADDYGRTPLHLASGRAGPHAAALVAELIAADPGPAALRDKSSAKLLPLHIGALHGAPAETVAALLKANPAAAAELDSDNRLPLRYALTSGAPHTVVQMILQAHPAACDVIDNWGKVPLSHALAEKAAEETVLMVLEASPGAATPPRGEDGKYERTPPLHDAITFGASAAVVGALLRQNMEAAEAFVSGDTTPLHAACEEGAPAEVLRLLIEAHPAAAAAATWQGSLPLHLLAASRSATAEAVDAVAAANPASAETKDKYGLLPLHSLRRCSGAAARALVRANPAGLAVESRGGYLPLHVVAQWRGSADILSALAEADPSAAARTTTDGGNTPLHLAATTTGESNSDPPDTAAIRALLTVCPAAAGVRNKDGKVPLQLALAAGASADTVEALLLADPSRLCDVVENDAFAEAVHAVVRRHPRAAAGSRDAAGRQAAHLATGRCKQRLFDALFLLGRYELLNERSPKHRSATCVVLFATDHGAPSIGSNDTTAGDTAAAGGVGGGGGRPSSVCLKLMRHRAQFEREQRSRGGAALEGSPTSSPASGGSGGGGGGESGESGEGGGLGPEFVLPLLRMHELPPGARFCLEGVEYPFVLVMQRGEEDLAGEIAHARMSVSSARAVALALGRCLEHMHSRGVVHGDFKPLNCVRVSAENAADVNGHPAPEWKVIDLDAASPIGKGFLGLKASTVYSPPELVYRAASAGTAPEKGGGSGDGVGGAGPAGVEQLPWLAGGGGFRVRGVDERGVAVDPGQKGQFEPLVAHPSYDVWSFGCVLFEMLMRETLWHGNTDGNLSRAEDFALLASWPDAVKRDRLDRVPDRWAQALLIRLLARDPAARPQSMAEVLRHPFFVHSADRSPPRLPEPLKYHFFLSHFQGNAGPMCMALKFAVEAAVPGCAIWFDQDAKDKTEAGMMAGVESSEFFVLVLSQCVLARWFCQAEIRRALELRKPIVIVRTTDSRHGAAVRLPAPPVVRCSKPGCKLPSAFGPPGAQWPSMCENHADGQLVPISGPSAEVSGDALNFSLLYEDLIERRFIVDPVGLALSAEIDASGLVAASVPYYAELEYREVTLGKLLRALRMERQRPSKAQPAADAMAAAQSTDVLANTLSRLACGCRARALPPALSWHVCIIADGGAGAASAATVLSADAGGAVAPASAAAAPSPAGGSSPSQALRIKAAIEAAFQGARVLVFAPGATTTADVLHSRALLVFLTRGVLSSASAALPPLAAALAATSSTAAAPPPRLVMAHEVDPRFNGCPAFGDYLDEARAAKAAGGADVLDAFNRATSIPWNRDEDFLPVCGLKLLLEGLMD